MLPNITGHTQHIHVLDLVDLVLAFDLSMDKGCRIIGQAIVKISSVPSLHLHQELPLRAFANNIQRRTLILLAPHRDLIRQILQIRNRRRENVIQQFQENLLLGEYVLKCPVDAQVEILADHRNLVLIIIIII